MQLRRDTKHPMLRKIAKEAYMFHKVALIDTFTESLPEIVFLFRFFESKWCHFYCLYCMPCAREEILQRGNAVKERRDANKRLRKIDYGE